LKNNMQKKFKNVNIIGFGKVGSAYAYALQDCGYHIKYIISERFKNINSLSRHFPGCVFNKKISFLSLINSDIIIISVQDDKIIEIVKIISQYNKNLTGKIFFHTSGALSSDILSKLGIHRNYIGSMHPIQTFRELSVKNNDLLKDIYYGIEGDETSIKFFKILCKNLSSKYIELKKEDKLLYHISCVISSNYLITHLFLLEEVFVQISNADIMKVFMPLVNNTLVNIVRFGIPKSLTGPISRNDINTIKKHIALLKKNNPEILKYYSFMSGKTVEIALKQGSINNNQAKEIKKLLKKYSK